MTKTVPPIPPDNRSHKGPGSAPSIPLDTTKGHRDDDDSENRRMGGAKRYPSIVMDAVFDGFRFALPILQEDTPPHSRGAKRPE